MSSYNLAVLISGSGSNLQAIMDAANSGNLSGARVALVVSNREGAYGLERAKNHGVPSMVIDKANISELLKTLEHYEISGIVLAGYLAILPLEVINEYSGKIINIHPALLPLFGGKGFYGIKVHQAVLASGMKYSGATAHVVDCGIDTGAAIVRGVVPVLASDTAQELQKRVLVMEHKVLVKAVRIMVENKTKETVEKPVMVIEEKDRENMQEFAKGLAALGDALLQHNNP